ncbi:hypothetical protein LEP1GSC202_1912 [Leptospira yanagawae serovar Saopaulo str. Sao Paulo = ATCC 700523]|uniref:Uncharacterized protein n=1 Tax=Leptospira yanagawae serovar Saopaulo str. Sao Paulo = ATCC 700523 TaxID=1249483 RepID=A0A5E8HG02_9LEPT|nr:hypothetical protein LEP1GSC202_1912 [Leptospira yanagawae serovar Saopaulo str. Sao Paulo = ATCC 700523]
MIFRNSIPALAWEGIYNPPPNGNRFACFASNDKSQSQFGKFSKKKFTFLRFLLAFRLLPF